MFKNLFKRFTKKQSSEAPVSWIIAARGEKRLREVQEDLACLRENYAEEQFGQCPEDMFETIQELEELEQVLLKAKKRGWTPDKKVIEGITFDIRKQAEYMASKSYSQAEIDEELEWRKENLKEALIGLR